MATKVEEVLEVIGGMSVLELAELVKACEDKFGVSAAPAAVYAGAAAAPTTAQAEVVEQTEFDVILTGSGDKKIQVIKVVREVTGLGLTEAKNLVDNLPKPVKEKIKKEEAEALKAKLSEAGAAVEIK